MDAARQGSWCSDAFRQEARKQIDETLQEHDTKTQLPKSSTEIENQLYLKAKDKEDYLAMMAQLLEHAKNRDKGANPGLESVANRGISLQELVGSDRSNKEQEESVGLKKVKSESVTSTSVPSLAAEAVLVKSESIPEGTETIRGYDFNRGIDYHQLLQSYARSGFQAQNFGKAVKEINNMIDCKLRPIPKEARKELNLHPTGRTPTNCTIFLSYTSNLISAGVREVLKYLVQHNMVDCIVTTAGGIEEDFIKCMAPTYVGDFALRGRELRDKGINRIGNMLVPNDNYCKFEDWMMPILDKMLQEQQEEKTLWTPSRMIDRLGKEINHPDSVYYWAHKNNIPVFCPAITDGSLGDMIFFHHYKNPGLILDLVHDIRAVNECALHAVNSGMIILGGGVIKHHTCNANLMRNGADFAVYLNTASEFDGSDSGASPDEAVSWGKIRKTANPVKICAEATLVFPLLVAETFARREKEYRDFATLENG